MRDLAEAARVTVPTIYNLVGSKKALLSAAIEEQTARFVREIAETKRTTPASGILSVVEVCVTELLRTPRYYQSLLRMLLSTSPASPMRDSVSTAISREFERALDAMRAAGDLAQWTDPAALADRLGSHLRITSIEWAAGELDGHELHARALYGTCVMLLGVTAGESRDEVLRRAREAQALARPQTEARLQAAQARS